MAYKDLTFLLFAKDMSASRGFEKVAASGDAMATGLSGAMLTAGVAVAALGVAVGVKTVKMAADFETAVTRIVTDGGGAGESVKKLSSVIQNAGVDSGTSMETAAQAMYKVSSAGYTLARGGASVLKAALEGAAIGGADAVTVADALTTTMTDFGPSAGSAAEVMSKLTATVATGKTNLNDLAASLHSVLPNAAAAGLGLNEVLGAVGTLTAEGISAEQATENLNHSILALQSPSQVATQAMAGIGVSSLNVAKNLGERGLAGTYDYLLAAMAKHSKAGLVVVSSFASSAQAAASMKKEISQLPPSLANTAKEFAANKITAKDWAADLKKYPAITANLGRQFATSAKRAEGFSSTLRNGTGPQRTAAAQLEKMLGGTTGLGIALHLTGEHASAFVNNTKSIGAATTEAGGHVRGFAETQKTLNFQLGKAGAAFGKAGVQIGTAMLPALKELLPVIPKIASGIAATAPVVGFLAGAFAKVLEFNPVEMLGNFSDALKEANNPLKLIDDTLSGKFGPALRAAGDVGIYLGTQMKQLPIIAGTVIKSFADIGANIVSGLVGGLTGNFGQVTAAITGLVNSIPLAVRKLLGIASPSKVMVKLMGYVGDGISKGLLGSVSQVSAASSTLATAVRSAFSDKQISRGVEQSALADIKSMTDANSKLAKLGKERTAVLARASSLRGDRSAVFNDVTGATRGYGDITSYAAPGDAVQGLAALITKTKTFTSDLKSLTRKGVSGVMLQQLVNGWNSDPDTALTTANGLLANPGDLRQILSLNRQLASAGAGLGSYAAHSEYDSRINAASGKAKVLTWEMQRAAAAGLKKVAGDLHVHLNVNGIYAGTHDDLAKAFVRVLSDAKKKGQIPKNWATG